jgi:hypothetical protein
MMTSPKKNDLCDYFVNPLSLLNLKSHPKGKKKKKRGNQLHLCRLAGGVAARQHPTGVLTYAVTPIPPASHSQSVSHADTI